jgi:hypothetical protein
MSARVESDSRRSEFAPALDFSPLIKYSRTSVIRAWINRATFRQGYELKGDATTAGEASSSAALPVEEHGDDPTDDEEEVPVKKVSLADALNCAEILLELL